MSFSFISSYVLLWGLVLFQLLVILALLRQLVELRHQLEAGGAVDRSRLPIGTPAPHFSKVALNGPRNAATIPPARESVLLFLAASCAVCRGLADSLGRLDPNKSVPMVAVCLGDDSGCTPFAEQLAAVAPLVTDPAGTIAGLYRIRGYPTAVIIDDQGLIRGYGYPRTQRDLELTVEQALTTAPPAPGALHVQEES